MIVHEYALLGGPNCAKVGRYLSLISSMNSFVLICTHHGPAFYDCWKR